MVGDKERGTDALAPDEKIEAKPAGERRRKFRAPEKPGDGVVGQALRSAYQETVSEPVPDDLLDLLGKLS